MDGYKKRTLVALELTAKRKPNIAEVLYKLNEITEDIFYLTECLIEVNKSELAVKCMEQIQAIDHSIQVFDEIYKNMEDKNNE